VGARRGIGVVRVAVAIGVIAATGVEAVDLIAVPDLPDRR
jgi:hypothetical protein